MKRGMLAFLLTAILALGLLLTACGETGSFDDTPTPATSSNGPTLAPGVATPTAGAASGQKGAQIGTPVAIKDFTITLDSATLDGGSLKASFSVDNSKGSATVSLPSQVLLAYASAGGATLDPDLLCSTLAVRVDAGKTAKGLVCWQAPSATATTGMRIEYAPSSGAGTVDWDLP